MITIDRQVTLADPSLPHQIRIGFDGVSCNCRKTRGHNNAPHYERIAPFTPTDLKAMWDAYRDPANHAGSFG